MKSTMIMALLAVGCVVTSIVLAVLGLDKAISFVNMLLLIGGLFIGMAFVLYKKGKLNRF